MEETTIPAPFQEPSLTMAKKRPPSKIGYWMEAF
jgi:hypothetical protein